MIDQGIRLPEGVFRRTEDGQLMRNRVRFKAFVDEHGDRWVDGVSEGLRYEEHDLIPHPCALAPINANPSEILEAQRAAARADLDFLHPRDGWLTGGRKRERERPENLGSGVIRRERRRQPAPLPEDYEPTVVVTTAASEVAWEVSTSTSAPEVAAVTSVPPKKETHRGQ